MRHSIKTSVFSMLAALFLFISPEPAFGQDREDTPKPEVAPVLAGAGEGEGAEAITGFIRELWPASFSETEYLDIELWQLLSLAILVIISFVIDLFVRFLLVSAWLRYQKRRGEEASSETTRKAIRPLGLAAAGIFFIKLLPVLGLHEVVMNVIEPAVTFFVMLAVIWSAYRVVDMITAILTAWSARSESTFDDLLVPMVRKVLKVIVTVFGLIYIIDSFNYEIAPLLAGLGIGGVAFAFAAKDTLENLFGAVTIVIEQPFKVGDWIVIGSIEGSVEELGLRSVRIRTGYNSLVTIPTANLVRTPIDNYGARKYRRWKTTLTVDYATTPEQMESFCEGIRELIRLHPFTRKDSYHVWLNEFGASSLDIMLCIYYEVPDRSTELRERHRMMLDIMRLADRLAVGVAYPTQTLHCFEEGKTSATPAMSGADQRAEKDSRRAGRTLVRDFTSSSDWRDGVPEPYAFIDADESNLEDEGKV